MKEWTNGKHGRPVYSWQANQCQSWCQSERYIHKEHMNRWTNEPDMFLILLCWMHNFLVLCRVNTTNKTECLLTLFKCKLGLLSCGNAYYRSVSLFFAINEDNDNDDDLLRIYFPCSFRMSLWWSIQLVCASILLGQNSKLLPHMPRDVIPRKVLLHYFNIVLTAKTREFCT